MADIIARGIGKKNKDDIATLTSNLAESATQTYVDTELGKKVTIPGFSILKCVSSEYFGTITSEMSALKRRFVYNAPSGFNWTGHPLVNRIFTDGEGRFVTNFDVSELAATGKKYYVNVATGLDTNDGLTPETALKNVHTACKKTDVVEVIVASGYYDDTFAMNNWLVDKSISIKAATGADVTLSTRRGIGGSWVKSSGYTNVYQVNRTLVKRVFDRKFLDGNGDYKELVVKTSVASVDSTPGSMYYDGSILYVHAYDSRIADNDIMVFLDLYNIQNTGSFTIYLENIKVEGGKYAVYASNTSGNPTILAKNCTFKYAHFDDGCGHWGATAIYQGCLVAKNRNDGFSHNFNTIPTKAVEIDCISRHNGDNDGGNDNGSTSHDGCYVIRLNSAYVGNIGPNVADVGGSQSWNMGCVMAESQGSSDASRRGVTSSSNNGVTGNKIWLDSCLVYGHVLDINSDVDNFLYTRNCKFGTTNGAQLVY